jgi:serine/threonine protein phosphatase PrpC
MIKVNNQDSISELGKRTNNEDNFGYIQGATYVVCDGVGGSDKGEIASEITVKTFIDAFKQNPNADASEVLQLAESKMTAYINQHDHVNGMATTLTFSQIRDNGIYVAWVGDSRVYQFRNGQIVFQTTDHSWVNEALHSGILTPEEAVNHPKAHVITRAIQGSHKPTSIDKVLLTDIQKGDLFLQCSDGVLETWSNQDLSALFASLKDPASILAKIKSECAQSSKDNFTAIVFQINEANISNKNYNPSSVNRPIPLKNNIVNKVSTPEPQSKGKEKKVYLFTIIMLALAIPLSIYLTSNYHTSKDNVVKPAEKTSEEKKEAKPAEKISEENNAVKPAEQKSEENKEAKPAEKISEENNVVKPAEQKSEEKKETKPAESKTKDKKTEGKKTEKNKKKFEREDV